MKLLRTIYSRIAGLFGRARRDAELDAELDGLLQMHVDD